MLFTDLSIGIESVMPVMEEKTLSSVFFLLVHPHQNALPGPF